MLRLPVWFVSLCFCMALSMGCGKGDASRPVTERPDAAGQANASSAGGSADSNQSRLSAGGKPDSDEVLGAKFSSATEPIEAGRVGGSPHFYNTVHVLCIGINEYQHIPHPLNQAEADAKRVGETLATHFGYQPTYLLGPNATRSRITKTIEDLDQELGIDDALIIYIAGHGVAFTRIENAGRLPLPRRVGFIVPYDAEVQFDNPHDPRWDRDGINMRTFVDNLDKHHAHHVLVIADCCCSGFMTKRGQQNIGTYVNLLLHPSRTILAATTQNQKAGDGVFADQFVKTLMKYRANREPATITDIFDDVRNPVINASLREMTPQLSHVGRDDGEFVFFPRNIPESEITVVRKQIERTRSDPNTAVSASLSRGLFAGVIERANRRAGRRTKLAEVAAAMTAEKYWYGKHAAERTNYWSAMRDQFHKNAAWGDTLAMAGLHYCYAKGLGEKTETPNADAAYLWALTANQVEDASGVGEYLLGRCYYQGIGMEKNIATARELFRASAEKGFIIGQLTHAQLSLQEAPTSENARIYIPVIEEAARAQLGRANLVLGDAYLTGAPWGVRRDMSKAIANYQAAFDKGYYLCTPSLYLAYAGQAPGFGEVDLSQAESCLREAAEAGNAMSQFYLGINLLQPPKMDTFLSLVRDAVQGLYWLEQAAKQKQSLALITLAELYGYGWDQDVPMNHEKAKSYVEEAIAAGSSEALVVKGNWLRGDFGIYDTDPAAALVCFQQAGALGNPVGCDQAGRCYEAGLGVEIPDKFKIPDALHPKSHVALHWYFLATETSEGNEHSTERIEHFRTLLRSESRGLLVAPGFEPSFVLKTWKQVFPETAKAFEKRFLNDKMVVNNAVGADGARVREDVPAVDTMRLAVRLQEQGIALLESKQFRRAYEVLSRSIAQEPENVDTLHQRGHASKHLGNKKEALADYTTAIQLKPKHSRFYVSRAMLLWDMGDFIGMRRDAETAIRLEPDYGKSYLFLGSAHFRLGDFDKAIAAYDAAIKRGLSAELKPQAYHNRGAAWERKGEQSKAEQDFRRARELGVGP